MHLIKCTEEDFTHLLHSHSICTFSTGCIKIDYNLDGLERHLVQRFVLGKYIITHTLEIPQVRWQTQTNQSQTITSIKKNIPQVSDWLIRSYEKLVFKIFREHCHLKQNQKSWYIIYIYIYVYTHTYSTMLWSMYNITQNSRTNSS